MKRFNPLYKFCSVIYLDHDHQIFQMPRTILIDQVDVSLFPFKPAKKHCSRLIENAFLWCSIWSSFLRDFNSSKTIRFKFGGTTKISLRQKKKAESEVVIRISKAVV